MHRSTKILLLSLGSVGVLWALTRTQRGQGIAADALENVIVTAKKAGAAVAAVFVPRGIRNNNPGNIDWIQNSVRRWRGMIGTDGRFGIFDTPANGVRAIGGELRASIRKGQTIEQAIHEWAPPVENDTGRYVQIVAKAAGAPPDARLTESMIPAVALAIIKHENGIQPYNAADVAAWVYT